MKKIITFFKNSISLIVKGIFIGVANIIPGVSGGTMAVSLGIYDKLISSITNLLKDFKKSIAFLFPLLLGAGLGIVGFSYLIEYLLSHYPLPTALAFIGLIFGGLPVMWKGLRAKQTEAGMCKFRLRIQDIIVFALFLALAAGLPLMKESTDTMQTLQVNPGNACMLFFGGIIAAATMVVPGVSGSMVMMILGFYYGVLNLITGFFDSLFAFDIKACFVACGLLIPFGVGIIIGIFIIAKLIDYLFEKHGVLTYAAIFGLVAASPFAIIYNTAAYKSVSVPGVCAGLVLFAVLGAVTYFAGREK